MPAKPDKVLTQVVKKIPLFDDLFPSHIQKVLTVCHHRSYHTNQLICGKETANNEVYFLISGRVAIKKPNGALVIILTPVATIGEMTIVAQQQRTSTSRPRTAARLWNLWGSRRPTRSSPT